MSKSKRIALCGVLTALALALSLAERMIPLELLIPIPGIKLGLANVVTMFALLFLTPREAFAILFCRVTLAALFAGSVTSFAFSLLGGLCALTTTWILLHRRESWFSLYGISAASAAMHNVGQIAAASVIFKNPDFFLYLPVLTVFGALCGILTGKLTERLLNMLKIRR